MPTFVIFKAGREVHRVRGADPVKLSEAVKKLAAEAETAGDGPSASSSGGPTWLGAALPKPYSDITDQVDVRGLDVLNADPDFGTARVLFAPGKPSALGGPASAAKDWLESDTDEQLMLYVPFQASLKLHTLHITSAPLADADAKRPSKLKLYTNRAHNLGFEEADGMAATQEIDLPDTAWDAQTATAKVELRFVKFQNVTSLVVYVVAAGGGERARVDRVRVVGESGLKRDLGKLEKVGDE